MIINVVEGANLKIKMQLIEKILTDLNSAYLPESGLSQIASKGLLKLSNQELTALEIVISCRRESN